MNDPAVHSPHLSHAAIGALEAHVAVIDDRGVIVSTNAAWERFAASEAQGVPGQYGVGADYLAVCRTAAPLSVEARLVLDALTDLLAGRRDCFECEYECSSPSRERWFVLQATRFVHDGRPFAVVVHTNVTPYKAELNRRVEDALLRQTHRLSGSPSQRMEALGGLAAAIAHSFNNLLTTVLGYGSQVLEDARPGSPTAMAAEEIQRAGERAAALTRQLLLFSRQESMVPQVIDLHEVILGVVPRLRRLLTSDVPLTVSLAPRPAPVRGTRADLEELVTGLAVQARDGLPRGGTVGLSMRVSPALGGESLLLEIAYAGDGLEPDVLLRALGLLPPLDFAGHGVAALDLPTVRARVEALGGSVRAEIVAGCRLVAVVILPLVSTGDEV